MLGSVAVAEVQQILGWRSDKAAEILAALNYAQKEREKPGMTLPWWLLTVNSVVTVADTGTIAVPTNFIQEAEETTDGNLYYTSPTNRIRYLRKMDWRTARESYYGVNSTSAELADATAQVSGEPEVFAFVSSNLVAIFPTPDAAYTLTWLYWAQDDPVALNEENNWLLNAPWVLIGEAAKKLGADLGNSNAVATASSILDKAETNLFRSVIHRAEVNVRRSMGSRL